MKKNDIEKHLDMLKSDGFWDAYLEDDVCYRFEAVIDMSDELYLIDSEFEKQLVQEAQTELSAMIPRPDSVARVGDTLVAQWCLQVPLCLNELTKEQAGWMTRNTRKSIPDLPVGEVTKCRFLGCDIDPLSYLELVYIPRLQAPMFRVPDDFDAMDADARD